MYDIEGACFGTSTVRGLSSMHKAKCDVPKGVQIKDRGSRYMTGKISCTAMGL